MPNRNVASVQVLRGFAALLVVIHHTIRAFAAKSAEGIFPPMHDFLSDDRLGVLSLGVDIFFVVSGFIMVYVSKGTTQTPVDFLARRFIRIFPMYWIVTGVMVVGALWLLRKGEFNADVLHWSRLISSLALFPSINAKGLVQPILGVGWTLSYEMLFYLLFAVALAVRVNMTATVIGLLACTFVGAHFLFSGDSAIGMFLTSPILFEFGFGCVIAHLYCGDRLPSVHPVAIAAALIAATFFMGQNYAEHWRVFYLGMPAAIILCGFLSMKPTGAFVQNRALQLLGDASYAIYLAHLTIIFSAVIKPMIALNVIVSHLSLDAAIVIAVLAACLGGVIVHKWVEVKIHQKLMLAYRALSIRTRSRAATV